MSLPFFNLTEERTRLVILLVEETVPNFPKVLLSIIGSFFREIETSRFQELPRYMNFPYNVGFPAQVPLVRLLVIAPKSKTKDECFQFHLNSFMAIAIYQETTNGDYQVREHGLKRHENFVDWQQEGPLSSFRSLIFLSSINRSYLAMPETMMAISLYTHTVDCQASELASYVQSHPQEIEGAKLLA